MASPSLDPQRAYLGAGDLTDNRTGKQVYVALFRKGSSGCSFDFCQSVSRAYGCCHGNRKNFVGTKNLIPARAIASPFYSEGAIVVSQNGNTMVVDKDSTTNQAKDSARYSLPRNLSSSVPLPIVVNKLLFTFMGNVTVVCVQEWHFEHSHNL